MSLLVDFLKNLPVSCRKIISEQDTGGPKEINIFIKSRERCKLTSVVILVNTLIYWCSLFVGEHI